MEYLLSVATFGLGWWLGRLDVDAHLRPKLNNLASQSFEAGTKYGAAQMYKYLRQQDDNDPMGLNITMKKD